MLSKKCAKLKEVGVSGVAAGPVNKAWKALEELNCLSWLFPFVKVNLTTLNLAILKETDEEGYDDEGQKNVNDNDEYQNEVDVNRELANLSEQLITKTTFKNSTKNRREEIEKKHDNPILKWKLTGKIETAKWNVSAKSPKLKKKKKSSKPFQVNKK